MLAACAGEGVQCLLKFLSSSSSRRKSVVVCCAFLTLFPRHVDSAEVLCYCEGSRVLNSDADGGRTASSEEENLVATSA